jgi:hypothetical protein
LRAELFRAFSRIVRCRLVATCLLAAWLCANGALLDVGQAYAWAHMFAGYVRTTPIAQAAAETFDPAKPCAICQAVQQAREASPKPAVTAPAGQLTLASQRTEDFFAPTPDRAWGTAPHAFAPVRQEPVFLRPPRIDAA